MIFEIFALIFAISVLFIWLGFYTDITVLKLVGFGFIFILGSVLLLDSIEYKSGDQIIQAGSTTTVTAQYGDYQSNTFGLLISAAGVLGWVMIWIQYRADKRFVEDS